MGVFVLLVEDDPGDALLVARALEGVNIVDRVVVSNSGEAALQRLKVEPLPDLLLLDLHLPGMDGFEVLQSLKAEPLTNMLPVIVFSGSQDQADVLRAYQHHASAFVSKPENLEEYGNAVRAVCDFWLGVAQLPDE